MFLNPDTGQTLTEPAAMSAPHMQPVAFAGCFGWFHSAETGCGHDTVALLCPGVSQDASTGYRSYRLLADRLAAAGYPALRFDYLGTGDSCDTDASEHWAIWQNSIHAAVDWLRASTNAHRVVLFGLRIGATLAAVVAERRSDVAGLVLLAPVLRGKTYINQLAVEARLREAGAASTGDSIVLGELSLSGETQRLMRQIDLCSVRLQPDCKVAIYASTQTPVLLDCVQTWRSRQVDVTCDDFPGLDALLRPTHHTDEPSADFSGVVAWLRRAIPCRPAPPPAAPVPAYPVLRPAGCIETALCFGEEDHLCGILCQPTEDAVPELAVVIANSGGNPHHGFARFSVEFARHLARAGVASFRIDFAGLGDSRNPADDNSQTDVFAVDRTGDMRAAVDKLEELGYRRFAAHGLCSGAYHALYAGLADPRFSVLLLVNLPWFTLRHEKSGEFSVARGCLADLERHQTRTQFLFADADTGLKQFERHFGPRGDTLRGSSGVAVEVVAGWDHELTGRDMRQTAGEHMLRFLLQSAGDR